MVIMKILFFSVYHDRYIDIFKYVKVCGLTITNGNTLKDHHNQNEGIYHRGGGINIKGYSHQNQNFFCY